MKIYDCFPFCNEYELLELRLELLNEVVDKFVIVESKYTQRGEIKGYNFSMDDARFKKYKDKIILIKCDEDVPVKEFQNDQSKGFWINEFHQRNAIIKGLINCNYDDIIVISDVDEIPNPDILSNLDKKMNFKFEHDDWKFKSKIRAWFYILFKNTKFLTKKDCSILDFIKYSPVVLEQDFYNYFMNWERKEKWYGSIITQFGKMSIPQELRDYRCAWPCLHNGGWHFSYMGGAKKILAKFKSIADIKPYIPSLEEIEEKLNSGISIFDSNYKFKVCTIEKFNSKIISNFIKKHPEMYKEIKI